MMTDFHFNGQRLDNDLVMSISCVLDAAGVPNLLWGNYLLTVYGVPTIVDVGVLATDNRCSSTTYRFCDRVFPLLCLIHLLKSPPVPS